MKFFRDQTSFNNLMISASLLLLSNCGTQKDVIQAESTSTQQQVPADSTGAEAPVTLNLSDGSNLALQAASDYVISDSISLTEAKINLGRIKLKTEDDEDKVSEDDEKTEDENSEDAQKSDEENIDSEDAEKSDLKNSLESEFAEQLKASEDAEEELKKQYESDKEAAQTEEEEKALEASYREKKIALENEKEDIKAEIEAELEAYEDNSSEGGNIKWKGTYLYEPISGVVSPDLPEVAVYDGTYKSIEFKIKPARDTADTDMTNRSVYLFGTVSVAGNPVNFQFSTREDMEFKMKPAIPFVISPDLSNELTIAFDLKTFFTDVDLTQAVPAADGSIYINADQNQEVYKLVLENIKGAAEAHNKSEDKEDENDDSKDKGDESDTSSSTEG